MSLLYKENPQYDAFCSLYEFLPPTKADIVFVGDSITERCQWQEFFPDKVVINRGIGSDICEGVLNRMKTITRHKPELIFIMIGNNDIGKNITISQIISQLKKIIEIIASELPHTKLYIQSMLPVNDHITKTEDILELNRNYKQLCDNKTVFYIDLFPFFANGNGLLKKEYDSDGVHLTGAGYKVWFDIISPICKNSFLH
jgi:lysophospholipase L1-like esterase